MKYIKNAKFYLKVAAIINLAAGILVNYSRLYSMFLLIFCFLIFTLSTQEEKELEKQQTLILIMACISCAINIFSAVFLFMSHSEISNYKREQNPINAPPIRVKRAVDPEVRKIDILLKLGVGMVFISGVLFATTSWNFISDGVKAIALMLLGILFLGLSFFTEKKLKLYQTSYIYWVLSMSLFLLSIVAILYFGIISSSITYQGEGKVLAYFLTYLTVVGLSAATYLKFPKKYILHVTYTSAFFALNFILRYMNIENMMIVALLSLIVLAILIAAKKETVVYEYAQILTYWMPALALKCIMVEESSELSIFLACISNLAIQYYLTISTKDENHIENLILTYLLLIIGLYNIPSIREYASLIFSVIVTTHTLLTKFNIIKVEKWYQNINYVLYTLVSFYFFIDYQDSNLSCMVTLLHLATTRCLTEEIKDTMKIKIAHFVEPVSVALLIISILRLDIIQEPVSTTTIISMIALTYCIIHYLTKNEYRDIIYFITSFATTLVCLNNNSFSAITAVITGSYLFLKSNFMNDNSRNAKLICTYFLMLAAIYNFLSFADIIQWNSLISSIIFICFLILMIIFNKEKLIKQITYFLILIPLLDIINYLNSTPTWHAISLSTLALYGTYLVIEFICKKQEEKNTLGLIGLITAILIVFEEESYIAGIYIGIVGLIAIFLSFYRKELKYFFYAGIIITVVNIIYRFRNFWGRIPFWLYLLIGGLTLIGFVTYKEVKKMNDKDK